MFNYRVVKKVAFLRHPLDADTTTMEMFFSRLELNARSKKARFVFRIRRSFCYIRIKRTFEKRCLTKLRRELESVHTKNGLESKSRNVVQRSRYVYNRVWPFVVALSVA